MEAVTLPICAVPAPMVTVPEMGRGAELLTPCKLSFKLYAIQTALSGAPSPSLNAIPFAVTVPEMAGRELTVTVPEMGCVYGFVPCWSATNKFPSPSKFIFETFAVTVPAIVCVPVGLAVTVPAIVWMLGKLATVTVPVIAAPTVTVTFSKALRLLASSATVTVLATVTVEATELPMTGWLKVTTVGVSVICR
jgi:hypothetical protein